MDNIYSMECFLSLDYPMKCGLSHQNFYPTLPQQKTRKPLGDKGWTATNIASRPTKYVSEVQLLFYCKNPTGILIYIYF